MMSRVVGFEVMGQDADKLRAFYGALLGWRFEPRARGGLSGSIVTGDVAGRGGARAESIVAEGLPGTGLVGRIGQSGPGHPSWMLLYNEVPDVDVAVRRAVGLGSRVLMAPVRLADSRLAVVSDPEGHPVGLCSAA